MLRRFGFVVVLAGCGRIGFDTVSDGSAGDDAPRLVTAGGAANANVDDVALTDAGELLMVGGFAGTLELGGRSVVSQATLNDVFVAAIARGGAAQWLWNGGCSSICNAQGVVWLGGGGAVAGGYLGGTLANGGGLSSGSGQDALMTWFSAGGELASANQFGATRNVQIRGLAGAGNTIAVTGLYAETVDFGRGNLANAGTNDNAFMAVFDATTRAVRFDRAWLGAGDVYGNDIAVAADGSVCVVGRFMATTDFGGGTVTPNSNDAFIVRYDAQGAFSWARTTNAPISESGAYVTALDNGDCVVAGFYQSSFTWDAHPLAFAGAQDLFIARLAAGDGAIRWVHTLAGTGYEDLFGIASHGDDRIALGGVFEQTARLIDRDVTADGGVDGFVIVLDGAGAPLALHQLGGAGDVQGGGGGIAFDPSGTHVAAGFTFSDQLAIAGLNLAATATGDDGAVLVLPAP